MKRALSLAVLLCLTLLSDCGSSNKVKVTPRKTPDQITGLLAWYKADAIPALNDGGAVNSWDDSTGNGHGLLANYAGIPTFRQNVVNGLPVVRFLATDGMGTWPNNGFNISPPWTWIVVGKCAVIPTDGYNNTFISGTSAHTALIINPPSGDIYMYDWPGAVGFGNQVTDRTGAFHIFTAIVNGASTSLYVDGLRVATGTMPTFVLQSVFLGQTDLDQAHGAVDIAETAMYGAALVDADRQSLESGLSTKYALPLGAASRPGFFFFFPK
jgi:hypothetical protein